MPNQIIVSSGGSGTSIASSFEAAEYLQLAIGQEAAQKVNFPEVVHQTRLVDRNTLKTHLRYVNPVEVTAGNATEGSALPVTAWSPTGVTFTAGLTGLSFNESKVVDSIDGQVLTTIVQQGVTSLQRSLDGSFCALMPTFSGGTIGATGTPLTVKKIIQGIANLDANHADSISGYVGRLHPQQFFDLVSDMLGQSFGVSRVNADATQRNEINIDECILKKNTYVNTVNTAADYCGGIFNLQALAMSIAQDLRVEVLPIPGQHMWTVDCTFVFGTSVYRGTFGCPVISGVSA